MKNIQFSISLPEEMVDQLEERIDGRYYRSKNSVVKQAVKEFLEKGLSFKDWIIYASDNALIERRNVILAKLNEWKDAGYDETNSNVIYLSNNIARIDRILHERNSDE